MNGNDLIKLGYETGPHFSEMLAVANTLEENDVDHDTVMEAVQEIYDEYLAKKAEDLSMRLDLRPSMEEVNLRVYIDEGETDYEKDNIKAVFNHVNFIRTLPTVTEVAVMPDACPAGSALGTIPVGTVAVAKNAIHPGMHSADICCSMFLTSWKDKLPTSLVLDAVQERSHFGVGGRSDMYPHSDIVEQAEENSFLNSKQSMKALREHMGTQGDGNHFFFVGEKESNGEMTFVTHHGSRKFGALLYKEGMKVANKFREKYMPDLGNHLAWIPFDTDEGQEYWKALQIVRSWTENNHRIIHLEVASYLGIDVEADTTDHFWNEHNFVFKKDDLFYHAKGSTPVWGGHAHDADVAGRTIIPLNMGEPILIVKNSEMNDFGFAPHGAGRNMSRTQFMKMNAGKTVEQIMKEQAGHVDARFYSGRPDASELPGAYKCAESVQRQIEDYGLAKIHDRILPLGSMMAGEFDKPWLKKK